MTRRIHYVEPWTVDSVAARVREAAHTLHAVRGSTGPRAGGVTSWPAIVRDWKEAYGYAVTSAGRAQATAPQISRLDVTIAWLSQYLSGAACTTAGLAEDSAAVVWWRASGLSYARIGALRKIRWGGETRGGGRSLQVPGGNARPSLVRIERAALSHLAMALNRTEAPVDRDARDAKREPDQARRQAPSTHGIRAIAPERGPPQYDDLEDEDRPVHARVRSRR